MNSVIHHGLTNTLFSVKVRFPRLGPVAEKALIEAGYKNPYQLIGKFLDCKEEGDTTQERCDLFVRVLIESGVPASYVNSITLAMANKMDRTFPCFFYEHECALEEDSLPTPTSSPPPSNSKKPILSAPSKVEKAAELPYGLILLAFLVAVLAYLYSNTGKSAGHVVPR